MAKVLIIDDSRFSRRKLLQLLNELEINVDQASNGNEGLEFISNNEYDLIFCDLLMPKYDGYYFIENFRKINDSVPVYILTADIQDTTKKKVLSLGATSILNKPISRETIQSVFANL